MSLIKFLRCMRTQQVTAYPAYVPLNDGTADEGCIVRVLNLFTGDGRRTPLMPRKETPGKHKEVNSCKKKKKKKSVDCCSRAVFK